MNTVEVIAMCQVSTETGKILGCTWQFRIHISLFSNLLEKVWNCLTKVFATGTVPFSNRDSHNPCVELHTTFVTLAYGECKSIVAW